MVVVARHWRVSPSVTIRITFGETGSPKNPVQWLADGHIGQFSQQERAGRRVR